MTADHTPERLSEEERDAQIVRAMHVGGVPWEEAERLLREYVAARLADQAARLAAVEALCDDIAQTFIVPTPGTNFGRSRVVRVGLIRAALHPQDPDQERTSG